MCIAVALCTVYFGTFLLTDSQEYLLHFSKRITPEDITKRPPIYPALLAVLGKSGTLILQNIIVIFVFWRMLVLSKLEIRTHSKQWFAATFLVLFSASAFIYANKIMAEILVLLLLWLAFEALRLNKWFLFLLMILVLPFVKPVFYMLPVFLMPFFLFLKPYRSAKIILGLLFCFGISQVYIFYNKHRTGVAEFSSIQHINALHYNKYQFDVAQFGADRAMEIQDSIVAVGATMAYPQKVELYNTAFFSTVKAKPLRYIFFHLKGAALGLIDPGRFDFQSVFAGFGETGFLHRKQGGLAGYLSQLQPSTLLVLVPFGLFNLLRLCFATFGFVRSQKSGFEVFAALAILYLAAVTGPINAARFMVPIVPFLLYFMLRGFSIKSKKA